MTFWTALQVFVVLLGLCVGSFLNVCIARMPEDRSIAFPGSHCPRCGHAIAWYDNIPVLSWILLGAKCRSCRQPIAATYPLIEACTAVLVLVLWRHLVREPRDLDSAHLAAFAYYLIFVGMLVALTFIDLRHHIIPDEFSIYAAPFGILGAWGITALAPAEHLVPTWQQAAVGAAAGGGFLWLVGGIYWLIRRGEGIGYGDVKLLAMMGAFLGCVPALLTILLIGPLAGSVVGIGVMLTHRKGLRTALPFGPFLALGALVHLLFGDELTRFVLTRPY